MANVNNIKDMTNNYRYYILTLINIFYIYYLKLFNSMRNLKTLLFLLLIINQSYSQSIRNSLKKSESLIVKKVLKNLKKYEVQILLTEIKEKKNKFKLKRKKLLVNNNNYFYPASTIKLPIALLTIEKINKNPKLNLNSSFIIEGDNNVTTFKKEILNLFVLSSNESYNRLFEFLGQDYINSKLREKGFKDFRISHRLSTINSDNLKTKEIKFYNDVELVHIQKSICNKPLNKLKLKKLIKGDGFFKDNKLINKSMNFSHKNYFSIKDLNDIIISLFFPNVLKNKKFDLSKIQLEFIKHSMSTTTSNLGYSNNEYPDNYTKFFILGDRDEMINEMIYNKVGNAYGYSIDNAYIYNKKSDRHFILTASIYTNENNILNDNNYEYDEIGIPFLAEIGRLLTKYDIR